MDDENKSSKFKNIKNNPKYQKKISFILSILKSPFKLNKLLYNKYGFISKEIQCFYIDALIFSKRCRLTSKYQDYLIWDFKDEYLKRIYFFHESFERIKKLHSYYDNYMYFFCRPFFMNSKANTIVHAIGENQAVLYYDRNIKKNNNVEKQEKKKTFLKNERDYDLKSKGKSSKNSNESENKFFFKKIDSQKNMLFDSVIKKNIENFDISSSINKSKIFLLCSDSVAIQNNQKKCNNKNIKSISLVNRSILKILKNIEKNENNLDDFNDKISNISCGTDKIDFDEEKSFFKLEDFPKKKNFISEKLKIILNNKELNSGNNNSSFTSSLIMSDLKKCMNKNIEKKTKEKNNLYQNKEEIIKNKSKIFSQKKINEFLISESDKIQKTIDIKYTNFMNNSISISIIEENSIISNRNKLENEKKFSKKKNETDNLTKNDLFTKTHENYVKNSCFSLNKNKEILLNINPENLYIINRNNIIINKNFNFPSDSNIGKYKIDKKSNIFQENLDRIDKTNNNIQKNIFNSKCNLNSHIKSENVENERKNKNYVEDKNKIYYNNKNIFQTWDNSKNKNHNIKKSMENLKAKFSKFNYLEINKKKFPKKFYSKENPLSLKKIVSSKDFFNILHTDDKFSHSKIGINNNYIQKFPADFPLKNYQENLKKNLKNIKKNPSEINFNILSEENSILKNNKFQTFDKKEKNISKIKNKLNLSISPKHDSSNIINNKKFTSNINNIHIIKDTEEFKNQYNSSYPKNIVINKQQKTNNYKTHSLEKENINRDNNIKILTMREKNTIFSLFNKNSENSKTKKIKLQKTASKFDLNSKEVIGISNSTSHGFKISSKSENFFKTFSNQKNIQPKNIDYMGYTTQIGENHKNIVNTKLSEYIKNISEKNNQNSKSRNTNFLTSQFNTVNSNKFNFTNLTKENNLHNEFENIKNKTVNNKNNIQVNDKKISLSKIKDISNIFSANKLNYQMEKNFNFKSIDGNDKKLINYTDKLVNFMNIANLKNKKNL